jgi:hypothetical protein
MVEVFFKLKKVVLLKVNQFCNTKKVMKGLILKKSNLNPLQI